MTVRRARSSALALFCCLIAFLYFGSPFLKKIEPPGRIANDPNSKPNTHSNGGEVLGQTSTPPGIYISNAGEGFAVGGVITLASTDAPELSISGYNLSGTLQLKLYKATPQELFNYLVHDKDGKQVLPLPDTNQLPLVAEKSIAITDQNKNSPFTVALPFDGSGVWYATVTSNTTTASALILRSTTGVIAKEGDNQIIFWGQNFQTKRSVNSGSLRVYSMLGSIRELQSTTFSKEGIATAKTDSTADIAIAQFGSDIAMIPLNLDGLNMGEEYDRYQSKTIDKTHFTYTDRPLYAPGNTVYFRSIIRDDDDARYTIPKGRVKVEILANYYDERPVHEQVLEISENGTIAGSYQLPPDAKTGYYVVRLRSEKSKPNESDSFGYAIATFLVDFFKKPEFSLTSSAEKEELIAGDTATFMLGGQYFSGQALAGKDLSYALYASDFEEYEYWADEQRLQSTLAVQSANEYVRFSGKQLGSGIITLDTNGQATLSVNTKMDFNKGKSQIFTLEVTTDDGSETPAFTKKNILVKAGEFGVFRTGEYIRGVTGVQQNIPLSLLANTPGANLSNRPLEAKITRSTWIAVQNPGDKYPQYKEETEELTPISTFSDKQGKANLAFTPSKTGSYSIQVTTKDTRNNLISKSFSLYVSDTALPQSQSGFTELVINKNKESFKPGESASITISSATPDRDVFLSFERGRLRRYQVVKLNGKSATVQVPLLEEDIPTLHAVVSAFSSRSLDTDEVDIPVSAEGKRITVSLKPDRSLYGPGDPVTLTIQTSDTEGNPVSADVGVWSVDKALYELRESNLGDIFETFWQKRWNTTTSTHSLEGISAIGAEGGGGCFVAGTRVLMADGTQKPIEQVTVGESILTRKSAHDPTLVKAQVTGTHTVRELGYMILNRTLKVTPNHRLWSNGEWKEAGSIQLGDSLMHANGTIIPVTSVEWQLNPTQVFNLTIEKYHTYIAGDVWVHNEKGDGPRMVFKDTAYWNPSVQTNAQGTAVVTFTLPDNLTSWKLLAVANTTDTKVGQTDKDITVNKAIIVRPILPNILRVNDKVTLSALVQNFSEKTLTFAPMLQFSAGTVEKPEQPSFSLAPNESKRVFWNLTPTVELSEAELKFTAVAQEDDTLGDTIIQKIPVRSFGFTEQWSKSGTNAVTYAIPPIGLHNPAKSTITLSLSPTLLSSLPESAAFLLNYEYGCAEQTASKISAALASPELAVLGGRLPAFQNARTTVQKSIQRLADLQRPDGGWGYWAAGTSQPFVTAYVIEQLLLAESSGYKIKPGVLSQARLYLQSGSLATNPDQAVHAVYGLSLLNSQESQRLLNKLQLNLNTLPTNRLALVVLSNLRAEIKDPAQNGLNQLIGKAQKQGDGSFWEAGEKSEFGSTHASTALALRALMLADAEPELVNQGVRFLSRTRNGVSWSNTFATAQVVQTLVNFAQKQLEITPDLRYTISLDGKNIASGIVRNVSDVIEPVSIPLDQLKQNSSLKIETSGTGQLYSVLSGSIYSTNTKAQEINEGISISRAYINDDPQKISIGAGDSVRVEFTVKGLKTDEPFLLIADELPAGMVPINEAFTNEQFNTNTTQTTAPSTFVDTEITENGARLFVHQVKPGANTFSYRARVVSSGTFAVPPAIAFFMYNPTLRAQTPATSVTIQEKSTPSALAKLTRSGNLIPVLIAGGTILLITVSTIILLILKKKRATQTQAVATAQMSNPPVVSDQPPNTNTPSA